MSSVLCASFVYWGAQCVLERPDVFVVEVCLGVVKQRRCYGICGLLGEQALETFNGVLHDEVRKSFLFGVAFRKWKLTHQA